MSEITVKIIEQTIEIPTRVGIDGDDAFELWLKIPGNEGKTFQDWLDWIQQPATDMAIEVSAEEELRVTAELERKSSEIIRKENENNRVEAENLRMIEKQNMINARLISEELNEHPPQTIEVNGRLLWHYWDVDTDTYINTNIPASLNYFPNNLSVYQKLDITQVDGTSYISLINNNTNIIEEGDYWKILAKVGRTPQFSVGTVTTLEEGSEVSVVITLTGYDLEQNPQYTIDFNIPRGDKGEQGDSAYQVWLDEGHSGTIDDYLAYLQQPALDAAEFANEKALLADQKAILADSKATLANDAAIYANNKAEIANAAASNANAKADIANTAAEYANTARQLTEQATINANEKASLANSAANTANLAAGSANSAAELANTKAGLANDAAILANEKASLADNAATLATTKAGLANDAAILANEKALLAEDKANLANEVASHPPKIELGTWWYWDVDNDVYVDSGIAATPYENYLQFTEDDPPLDEEAWSVYSKTQGDYAKTQGDYAKGIGDSYDAVKLDKTAVDIYNVTLAVPLPAGSYYNSTTARAAVPVAVRKKGLELLYETSAGVWYKERYVGVDVANWTTAGNWEVIPVKSQIETIEEVTAQSLVELKAKIDALQKLVNEMILGSVQIDNLDVVKTFNLYGTSNMILTGTTTPSIIPDFIGQFYIKTTATKACYQATGNASVGDWIQIG